MIKVGDKVRILERNGAAVNIGDIGTVVKKSRLNKKVTIHDVTMDNPKNGYEKVRWTFHRNHIEPVDKKLKGKYYVLYILDASPKIEEFNTRKEAESFLVDFNKKYGLDDGVGNWIDHVFYGKKLGIKLKPSIVTPVETKHKISKK